MQLKVKVETGLDATTIDLYRHNPSFPHALSRNDDIGNATKHQGSLLEITLTFDCTRDQNILLTTSRGCATRTSSIKRLPMSTFL